MIHDGQFAGTTRNRPSVNVYVDGLNLFRRKLSKHPECKWLDIEALAQRLLPEFEIARVQYFTAIIKAGPGADVQSPQRQQAYLRALATLPRTEIYLGKFRIDPRIMPLHPTQFHADGSVIFVKVKKMEEKGSDVNLASHALIDAFRGEADAYAILSNDSDLVTPMRMIRQELHAETILLSPMEAKRTSNELKQTRPSIIRHISGDDLRACQLPDTITDRHGSIRRPKQWVLNSEGPTNAEPSNQ